MTNLWQIAESNDDTSCLNIDALVASSGWPDIPYRWINLYS